MRHVLGSTFALLFLVTAHGAAQDHATGWAFTGQHYRDPALGRITPQGAVVTIIPGSPLGVPSPGFTMDLDNRTYVLIDPNGGLLMVDPLGIVVRTVSLPVAHGSACDVMLDLSGDYLVASRSSPQSSILRVDRNTFAVQTLWSTTLFGMASFARHVDSGDFMVLGSVAGTVGFYRLASDGSAVKTLTSVGLCYASRITAVPGTGTFVTLLVPGFPPTMSVGLSEISMAGSLKGILGLSGTVGWALGADRGTSARPRLGLSLSQSFRLYDWNTKAVTTLSPTFSHFSCVRPDRFRNVATERVGPGRWVVHLDFPGEVGRLYAFAVSVSGVRPGVPLADGRRLLFNPDAVTVLGLRGQLGPILQGYAGQLDMAGRARGVIDVGAAPPWRGVPIWVQAVTLDRNASLGIHTIADPVLLIL